jgi:hypothetical protein
MERFKCHGCGMVGDVFDWLEQTGQAHGLSEAIQFLNGKPGQAIKLSPEAQARIDQIRLERLAEKEKRNREALDKLNRLAWKVDQYHQQVDKIMDYWQAEGITTEAVERWKLGYCPTFPVANQPEPTATIPYFEAGQLVNLRHRLLHPNGHGKYRPELAGLPNRPFNLNVLTNEDVPFWLLDPGHYLVVEGEKKAIVLTELGLPTVGLPGVSSWQTEWSEEFKLAELVYVVLDDQQAETQVQARRIARDLAGIGVKVVAVTTPCKPDDFFVRYGGQVGDFMGMLRQGRRI